MEQRIEPLNPEDVARVESLRSWARGHFAPEAAHLYEELDGKLRLLDTVLRSKWIEPTETWKLQSLGIAFGDALVQQLGLEWVAVEDEYGRDPALRLPGTTDIVFPLTMISKRVERGEDVDVRELFDVAVENLSRRQKHKP